MNICNILYSDLILQNISVIEIVDDGWWTIVQLDLIINKNKTTINRLLF